MRIIHQGLGHIAQVVRCPDQHRFVVHHTNEGSPAGAVEQHGGLVNGVACAVAGLDAEQTRTLGGAFQAGAAADGPAELTVVCWGFVVHLPNLLS